ncbi:MAG: glycosyltransferase family 2 protein [Chordicoccus sp.]
MMDIKTVCKKVFKKRSRADYLRILYGRLGFTYFIDHTFYGKYSAIIEGWIASRSGDDCVIRVYDAANEKIRASVTRYSRNDVIAAQHLPENALPGFHVEIRYEDAKNLPLRLVVKQGRHFFQIPLKLEMSYEKRVESWKKMGENGIIVDIDYNDWTRLVRLDEMEKKLPEERRTTFPYMPLFSVVVPLYRTPEKYLRELADSFIGQSYANWELILSDGSGPDSPLTELLDELEAKDPRIRSVRNGRQLHISENTNEAIRAAKGDFIVFCDHDDLVTSDALFENAKAINAHPDVCMLYSDEDKISDDHIYSEPHFKPDFNYDLLMTNNYICHLNVVRRSLIDEAGMLDSRYNGAQDYDFVLRCIEKTDRIVHIPKVLYHWRISENSTAMNQDSKRYAFDAGRRAVQAHWDRVGIPAMTEDGERLGLYRTHFLWKEKPLVSILIPNKDHRADLEKCIRSIEEKSAYRNFEIIVIENNSDEHATFAYYDELKKQYDNVRIITYEGGFNYSAINNFGVREAKGEYLLFLNNDTEMIDGSCLDEMLGFALRPDVGAVGARLFYDDDTVQHAGVIVGLGGIAGHAFSRAPRESTGYMNRMITAMDMSAVTAACMMVRRSVFEETGGFSEELAVAFNDIDFCMKVTTAGYRIVYSPYAELYHYESKSRGFEDTPEKQKRFENEVHTFEKKWPDILKNGDPCYNPNMTLRHAGYELKEYDEIMKDMSSEREQNGKEN